MTTLTDFLLARIAEDEAVAQAPHPSAHPDLLADMSRIEYDYGPIGYARLGIGRVLAECDAKRRIVKLHSIGDGGIAKNGHWNEATQTMEPRQYWYCGNCDYDRDYGFVGGEEEGCETLLLLASVYADHPDFNPTWKA